MIVTKGNGAGVDASISTRPQGIKFPILRAEHDLSEVCLNLGDAAGSSYACFGVARGDTIGECDILGNVWQLVRALQA